MIDAALLEKLNEYPDPACQIVGFVLKDLNASKKTETQLETPASELRSEPVTTYRDVEETPLMKRKTKYYSRHLSVSKGKDVTATRMIDITHPIAFKGAHTSTRNSVDIVDSTQVSSVSRN